VNYGDGVTQGHNSDNIGNRLAQCVSGGNASQFVCGPEPAGPRAGSGGLRRTSIVNGNATHHVLDNATCHSIAVGRTGRVGQPAQGGTRT
jgi:hypothetical protein